MGISKCSLFEGPLLSTLFRKTSLGLPDKFLSEERWFKKRMGVKNEFNRFFSLFSKLKGPGEKEVYLYMERLLEGN